MRRVALKVFRIGPVAGTDRMPVDPVIAGGDREITRKSGIINRLDAGALRRLPLRRARAERGHRRAQG